MFDLIIKEAASRFGLGDKAGPLVQMLVAYMTNKDTGGLAGFINMFKNKGLGDIVSSWLGGNAAPKAISGSQIENVLGGKGGFLEAALSKTGLGSGLATSALGYLLPSVLGKLTPGGAVPTSLSQEVLGFADKGRGLLGGLLGSGAAAASQATSAVTTAASDAGGGLMKWLWWIIPIAIGLWLIKSCTAEKAPAPKAKVEAPAPAAPAPKVEAPAPAAAPAAPAVATYLDSLPTLVDGAPNAKLYFDTGKTDIPGDTAEKLKPIIEYVKANAGTKAALSGYHDPTGDKAQNEELAKNRAKNVRESLRAAGLAEDQILMAKPEQTAGGTDLKEARRVEVSVRK
jgi:uncharacterized protein YidB (DUF937 family)/outer membrane protein OmpA-like peptidoglycan-associated protein